MSIARRFRGIMAVGLFLLTVASIAGARYSGGTGEPNDPYQIATAADLIALGEDPNDYGKHFILTADIDLDPNLPGRKVFDRAVIAPDVDDTDRYGSYQGTAFAGFFDGHGHVIGNLHIQGGGYLGLFGYADGAKISNLGLETVDVNGTGSVVGALVGHTGWDGGSITTCYSTGSINGKYDVGGLVGLSGGSIAACYSTSSVNGDQWVGGLVGLNDADGSITACYSTGSVRGDSLGGSLVGCNFGSIAACYSTGSVDGLSYIGGLVGGNSGSITTCYSTGSVRGQSDVGGLVGNDWGSITNCYSSGAVSGQDSVGGLVGYHSGYGGSIMSSFWNMDASGTKVSDGGVGLSTAEMMDPDVLGVNGFANDPNWVLDAGRDYPRLAWEGTAGQVIPEPIISWLDGQGTEQQPYRIDAADQLILLTRASGLWDKHFVLGADIDLDPNLLDRRVFSQAVIQFFSGVFDGNDHTISHLAIRGGRRLGLFGETGSGARISNVGLEAVDIDGTGGWVGSLVGRNGGSIAACHSSGSVNGQGYDGFVGGLVGSSGGEIFSGAVNVIYCSGGSITNCYSTSSVAGASGSVGGLVGNNYGSSITNCYSTGAVSGESSVGSLVGSNGASASGALGIFYFGGTITNCYSTGSANGHQQVGGLVGENYRGSITNCHSSGTISGQSSIGGLVGSNSGDGPITSSFWDIQTSGRQTSSGGTGLTTAEMQTASTFIQCGWDFVGEAANGTEDIWWIDEGNDYPRLSWEREEPVRLPVIELDAAGFDAAIAEGVVLVDFFATWCPHCTTQAPILEEVADRLEGRAQVAKLDVDKARGITQRYGVTAIPTLILFRDGVEVRRFVGVTGADVLVAAILAVVDPPE